MNFAVPGAVSAVVGALVGAIAVLIITTAAQQSHRPDVDRSGAAGSSLLNNVEYGSR
ncbi:DUF2613 domain-containing protein [Nocardia sp. alder85J]|uniref:DUF2613 domain-containing protein n=1 Tax=Nocardia sp. alder85J TaxID=2862949 RepID=UPI001CD2598F|nr:DUF2613 domain-containing protein [Nocardia sp. alder85J]MCX4096312.1 DUF2613 domain-containing protein [Nocardia sp. alder85J]